MQAPSMSSLLAFKRLAHAPDRGRRAPPGAPPAHPQARSPRRADRQPHASAPPKQHPCGHDARRPAHPLRRQTKACDRKRTRGAGGDGVTPAAARGPSRALPLQPRSVEQQELPMPSNCGKCAVNASRPRPGRVDGNRRVDVRQAPSTGPGGVDGPAASLTEPVPLTGRPPRQRPALR